MAPDEADNGTPSKLPTFEDLVERLGRSEGRRDPPEAESEPPGDEAEESDSLGDLTGDAEGVDESKWQWGGPRSTSEEAGPTTADPADRGTQPSGGGDSLVSDSKSAALLELIDDASNVLVLGPAASTVEYDLCTTLCETEAYPRRRVLVTTTQSADERLNALRSFDSESYDETAVIAVGDRVRSSGNGDPSSHALGGETVTIETINDPRDLTRLGLLINKHLGDPDDGPPPVLCFHTLSTLLQFAEVEKVFRFLHVLQGRVRSGSARAHYHLDPTDHPDEVVNTLRPIFDFTVRFDAAGEIHVDT